MCLMAVALSGAVPAVLPAIAQDLDLDLDLDSNVVVLPLEATVLDLVATVQDMAGDTSEISAEVQETLRRSGDIEVRQSGEDFILSVASDVLFGFDSAEQSRPARNSLQDVAEVILRAYKGQVQVVGHTDAKGPDAY